MDEFAEEARKKPDTLTLANSGIGTITHMAGETLASLYNIKLVMVPYKGGVEQLQDALAGHVSMMYEGNIFPHVKAGKLRALGVSTPFRHPQFPEIPTMKELKADWDMPSWFGFAGPAGMPAVVAEKLSPLLNQISDMPDVQERVLSMGLVAMKDTPQGMADDLKKQSERFGAAVKRLNIRVD
jgi:tripartite-type tricarboxylate transporter receptor subunit TctC